MFKFDIDQDTNRAPAALTHFGNYTRGETMLLEPLIASASGPSSNDGK